METKPKFRDRIANNSKNEKKREKKEANSCLGGWPSPRCAARETRLGLEKTFEGNKARQWEKKTRSDSE